MVVLEAQLIRPAQQALYQPTHLLRPRDGPECSARPVTHPLGAVSLEPDLGL